MLQRRGAIFGKLRQQIASVDVAFANLEAPLCNGGAPIVKSGPNLRADPASVAALADAGFQVAGLANNHIMDYGPEGLESTLDACRRYGIKVCGAGMDVSEAARPLMLSANGIKAALIAVAEREFNASGIGTPGAAILDPIDIFRQIAEVREEVDLLLVTIHGGNEYFPFPRPGLRRICKYIVDAGADGVICHHPHVAGAYEIYRDVPIIYSLGNFIFDADPPPPGWDEGYAVKLTFQREKNGGFRFSTEFLPYRQSVEIGGIELLDGEEKYEFLARIKKYRSMLENEHDWMIEWKNFCQKKRLSYISAQYIPFKFRGIGRIISLLKLDWFFLPRWAINRRKNMLRCDSHRELLSEILEQE